MEVIIDTCVLINAIYDQHDDCWEILRLLRVKSIIPIVSEALAREYIFIPAKVLFKSLEDKFCRRELVLKDFAYAQNRVYEIQYAMMKIIMTSGKQVVVTSKTKYSSDQDDDKLVNLAIDSNCPVIITNNKADFRQV